MSSGWAEIAEQGGHVVCLRDKDISEMKVNIEEMHRRLFVDNGKESIQTALITGAYRFKNIDATMTTISAEVKSLSAYVTSLADSIRQSNKLQQGIASGELTVEGMIGEVMTRIGKPNRSGSAMWISLAVVAVCATVVFVKIWGAL